ncbi:uncharacterized protein LOC143922033 [Arctopsyche grandis]|uniref:uncharacterized protein LOC143922033 n=1 Tax=Arctopsyche grandis TaxID=121162 RepID=UPI00406DA0C4
MDHHSNGLNTLEKINKALDEAELELISKSLSQKETMEINNRMSDLKIQKIKMSDNEANHKIIEDCETLIKESKGKLTDINTKLNERSANIAGLKEKLNQISETSRVKSPEILKVETKLNALKLQRDELFKTRTSLREKIHEMEEEFAKFEVTQLMKYGIAIPSNMENLKDSIEALNAKKVECSSSFASKNQKVNLAIAAIDLKIEAENLKISELPETDFELLKKGGFRTGGFKNKERI